MDDAVTSCQDVNSGTASGGYGETQLVRIPRHLLTQDPHLSAPTQYSPTALVFSCSGKAPSSSPPLLIIDHTRPAQLNECPVRVRINILLRVSKLLCQFSYPRPYRGSFRGHGHCCVGDIPMFRFVKQARASLGMTWFNIAGKLRNRAP